MDRHDYMGVVKADIKEYIKENGIDISEIEVLKEVER